jgi:ABC-type transport system substrate-binding protein
VPEIAALPDRFELLRRRSRSIEQIVFNHRHPLLGEAGVRRAFRHAVDRSAALEARLGDARDAPLPARRLVEGPFPPGSWRVDASIEPYRFEPAYGRELLREALEPLGYLLEPGPPSRWRRGEGGVVLRLAYPAGCVGIARACDAIADGMRRLGVEIVLEPLDGSTLRRRILLEREFDLFYEVWDRGAGADLLSRYDPGERRSGGRNPSGCVIPSLVEALHDLDRALPPLERAAAYRRIDRILHRESVALPLWEIDGYAAWSLRVVPEGIHPRDLFGRIDGWRLIALDGPD